MFPTSTLALGLSNTNTALVGAGCVVAGIGGTMAVQAWRRKGRTEDKAEDKAEKKAKPKAD